MIKAFCSIALLGTNSNSSENMCLLDKGNNSSCDIHTDDINPSYAGYYGLLLLGNILLGIGASPMFTIGLSYIDENCKTKMTALYISMYIYFLTVHSKQLTQVNAPHQSAACS